MRDDSLQFLPSAPALTVVCLAQLGTQQMVVTEDVQRQVAVAVIIAVEEPTLLVPVQRIVSGIQIQHDLLRGRLVAAEEHIDERAGDCCLVPTNLLVAVVDRRNGSLKSVQRALAGQRVAAVTLTPALPTLHVRLLTQRGKQRILPQPVMVHHVFVAQTYPLHPLGDHAEHRVLYVPFIPQVREAFRKLADDPPTSLYRA